MLSWRHSGFSIDHSVHTLDRGWQRSLARIHHTSRDLAEQDPLPALHGPCAIPPALVFIDEVHDISNPLATALLRTIGDGRMRSSAQGREQATRHGNRPADLETGERLFDLVIFQP